MARTSPARAAVPALVGVTFIWGTTFVMVKDAISSIQVMDFLAWRFGLATLAMGLLRPRALRSLDADGRRAGVLLGVVLGLGYVLQTLGLRTASASTSGFITGMFVVLTPLTAAVLLRRRVTRTAWLTVALATTGLALLSLRGWHLGTGELLTLGCALAFALHIVGLGEWSRHHDAYPLAVVQLAVVAVGCTLVASPGGIDVPRRTSVWLAIVVTSLGATALAFVVQTWAQAHLEPTRVAVIMSMEPVFAGGFAVVTGQALGLRELAGGGLIVAAMLAAELGPRRGAEGATARLES